MFMPMSHGCAKTRRTGIYAGCALVLLLPVALLAAGPDPKGCVLYLPLEDAQKPVDLSADPTTTTVRGTLSTAKGQFGQGLQFNGSNANILEVKNADKLSGMSALTVEAWVLPRNVVSHTGSAGMSVVSKRNANLDNDAYNLFVYTGRLVNGRVNHINTAGNIGLSKTVIADNTWYHLAFVFDGKATGTEKLKLYVNGVLESSTTHPAAAVDKSTAPLWVGELDAARGFAWDGVIDEVGIWNVALTAAEVTQVMTEGKAKLFNKGLATNPVPANGATDVLVSTDLAWTPGEFAATHNVYFGPAASAVEAGDPAVWVGKGLARDASHVDLGPLDFGRTYYWRVDEVNAAPSNAVITGDLWSFTTEPYGYPITSVTATASGAQVGMGPEKTVNGVGLAGDQHGTEPGTMWLSNGPAPIWIQFELDKVYHLHEMWVWNSNQMIEPYLGFGAKSVTVEYSTDGATWAALANVPEFARATGLATYTPNTTVRFGGVEARYVKLTINGSWGVTGQAGLSEVRFFYVPVQARAPQPANGAAGVALDAALTWRPGRGAQSHKVYFGTDRAAVSDGTAAAQTVTEAGFTPAGLNFGTTYYWKVDEVNTVTAVTYPGPVWSFTTREYAVVDDMESYTDDEGGRIYETWIDGWTNGTGSVVGHLQAPFAERTIVHGGKQSLPFEYNNIKAPFYSEAQREFAPVQNWTGSGADTLSLWVRGIPAAFVENAGTITMSAAGSDIWGTADNFRYACKTLTGNGSIVVRVESMMNTHASSKAGLMIRQTLDPSSKVAYMVVCYSSGVSFGWRPQPGGAMASALQANLVAPQWVKLTRTGDVFTAQYSADGKTWVDAKNADGTVTSTTIAMIDPVYIGLCLCSHNTAAINTAVMSGAATTGNVTGDWQVVAVGKDPQPANSPADLYVVVEDSAGKTATATDPTLVTAGAWTQWKVPLSSLTGVNLSRVKKLSIGAGNRAGPKAGGAGTLYFDDIGFGHSLP
jgi:hypothetical protein